MSIPKLEPRNDSLAQLVRQFLNNGGPEDEPHHPDMTAFPPLLDALRENANLAIANELEALVIHAAVEMSESSDRGMTHTYLMEIVFDLERRATEILSVLTYDVGSAARHIGGVIESHNPNPPQENIQAQMSMIRGQFGNHRVGAHVVLPDGRRCLVVRSADADGYSDVLPIEDSQIGDTEIGGFGPRPSGRRFIRSIG